MTTAPVYVLRDATPADALAIAALHVASWRVAYRGILPDDYLDGSAAAAEADARWVENFRTVGRDDILMVADGDAGLLGLIAVWAGREAGFDTYIDNLHVRPHLRGQRIGARLLGEATRRMIAAGHRTTCLWLLDGNDQGGHFYRRIGGSFEDHQTGEMGGHPIGETRVVWRDLPGLAKACDDS